MPETLNAAQNKKTMIAKTSRLPRPRDHRFFNRGGVPRFCHLYRMAVDLADVG